MLCPSPSNEPYASPAPAAATYTFDMITHGRSGMVQDSLSGALAIVPASEGRLGTSCLVVPRLRGRRDPVVRVEAGASSRSLSDDGPLG
jgi:hypothetical protein